jgi:hypothetical protein
MNADVGNITLKGERNLIVSETFRRQTLWRFLIGFIHSLFREESTLIDVIAEGKAEKHEKGLFRSFLLPAI